MGSLSLQSVGTPLSPRGRGPPSLFIPLPKRVWRRLHQRQRQAHVRLQRLLKKFVCASYVRSSGLQTHSHELPFCNFLKTNTFGPSPCCFRDVSWSQKGFACTQNFPHASCFSDMVGGLDLKSQLPQFSSSVDGGGAGRTHLHVPQINWMPSAPQLWFPQFQAVLLKQTKDTSTHSL